MYKMFLLNKNCLISHIGLKLSKKCFNKSLIQKHVLCMYFFVYIIHYFFISLTIEISKSTLFFLI